MMRMIVVVSWSTFLPWPQKLPEESRELSRLDEERRGGGVKQTTSRRSLPKRTTDQLHPVTVGAWFQLVVFILGNICSSSFHLPFITLVCLPLLDSLISLTFGGPEHFRSCVCQGISEHNWWFLTHALESPTGKIVQRLVKSYGSLLCTGNSLKCVFTFVHLCILPNVFIWMYLCTVYQKFEDVSDNWIDIQSWVQLP